MGVSVVHIFQPIGITDPDPPGQTGERVGESIGARPPHPLEQGRQAPRVTGADEPETAILERVRRRGPVWPRRRKASAM